MLNGWLNRFQSIKSDKYFFLNLKHSLQKYFSASVSIEVASQPSTVFQEKQGKKTIDVYWLSDDGGLNISLSHFPTISTTVYIKVQ